MKQLIITLLIITVVMAGIFSGFSSSLPDGLEKVAKEFKIVKQSFVPYNVGLISDYKLPGVRNHYLATSLAGIIGILIVLLLGIGFGRLLAKKDLK